MLGDAVMALIGRPRKILIPDVPPVVKPTLRPGLVIGGIGMLCAVIAAVLFAFLAA